MRASIAACLAALPAALFAAGAAPLAAQGVPEDIAQMYRLDLAVPEAPALLLAGVESDALLRPGSLHDLALSFGSFNPEGGGFRLPRSYGVEVAPLLLQRSFSRADYNRVPALSRLRVSLATHRGSAENSATALALGLRTSLYNGTDLRTDGAYLARIQPLLHAIGALGDSIRYAGRRICRPNDLRCLRDATGTATPPEVIAERVQTFQQQRSALVRQVGNIRDSIAQARWNAPVFDVAAAAGLLAADSLGTDPRLRAYAGWASWALPIGGWGQVVLGGRYSRQKTDGAEDWDNVAQGAARLYVGRNRYKGFVEGGVRSPEESRWLANGGAEIKLLDGFWATVTAGYDEQPDGDGRLTTRFSLRTAPQNARAADEPKP